MLRNKTRVRDGRGRPRKSTLNARKLPGQARSHETVSVILEAAARILESDGLRGFNTNLIAARAGVSIGSLYQYFPNKDTIVLALISVYEERLDHAVATAVQAGRGQQLRPRLRLFVRALVNEHYRRPGLSRVLEAEEERLGSRGDNTAFRKMVLQLLRDHESEAAIPISATTERIVTAVLRAVIDLGIASGAGARSTEHRAMRAVSGYLLYKG